MVSTRRTKRTSAGAPVKPAADAAEKMDTSEAPKTQNNKSKRWWKKTQTAPWVNFSDLGDFYSVFWLDWVYLWIELCVRVVKDRIGQEII